MADGTQAQLSRALAVSLGVEVRHSQVHLSENLHFRASHPEFGALFVKVYVDESRCRREGAVLELLGVEHDWVIPPVGEGQLDTGHRWRAFPDRSLRPFDPSVAQCAVAGRVLAELHATRGSRLDVPAVEPGWRVIDLRLRNLEPWPALHAEAARLARHAAPVWEALQAHPSGQVLLSGDFVVRNLHIDQGNGHPVLLDFERSASGDPHWDLGKLWDQGMRAPEQREAFRQGYRGAGGASWFPNPAALWATRFAAALGIFPYADRVGDTAFFAHGEEKLRTLAAELPALSVPMIRFPGNDHRVDA